MKRQRAHSLFLSLMIIMLYPVWTWASNLADPTRPPGFVGTGTANNKSLEVTAIFIYPTHRIAIINGQVLMVGDKINEFTVTTIEPNTVELVGSEQHVETLSLTMPVKEKKM